LVVHCHLRNLKMEETTQLLGVTRKRTTSVLSAIVETKRYSRRLLSTSSSIHTHTSFSNSEDDNEQPKYTISKIEAITHIVKSYLGIGILTLPVAFSNAGVVGGSIGLIITMFISVNCANILANAAIKLAASREISNMDYANTAEKLAEPGPEYPNTWGIS